MTRSKSDFFTRKSSNSPSQEEKTASGVAPQSPESSGEVAELRQQL